MNRSMSPWAVNQELIATPRAAPASVRTSKSSGFRSARSAMAVAMTWMVRANSSSMRARTAGTDSAKSVVSREAGERILQRCAQRLDRGHAGWLGPQGGYPQQFHVVLQDDVFLGGEV